MSDLMRYAAALDGEPARRLPPVESWAPAYCGEMDLTIRRDGVWVHEGAPIGRARLVRLLSTVLRKEGERFFLVTPAEKLGIRVEDAPFVAVLMKATDEEGRRSLIFTTNVGDEVRAGPANPIVYRQGAAGKAPYLLVRGGLEARIARAVFYDLVALGETREIDGEACFGVASDGAFFPFAPAADMLAGRDLPLLRDESDDE